MRSRGWISFLAAGALCAGAYAIAPTQRIEELWWQVATFGSAAAVLVGVRLHRPADPQPWRIVFAALATFAVMGLLGVSWWGWPAGHVIWPLRDVGLVVGFVLLGLATLRLVRARAPDGDPEGAIDGLIVMFAMAAVLWDTVFGPLLSEGGLSMAAQARLIAFPLLQAGVTAAAVRLLFVSGGRSPSAWLIFSASTVACAANVLWVVQGGGLPGLSVNVLWIMSFMLGGAAALHPSMRSLVEPARSQVDGLPFGRLVVLGAALVSLPVTVLREGLAAPQGPPASAAAAVLCAGLVLWRLGRLVHQRERVSAALGRRAAREAALARISERALLSTDADRALADAAEIVAATLEAQACELVRGTARVDAEDGPIVVPFAGWGVDQGALVVHRDDGGALRPGELEFLQAVTNVLAGALQRWNVEQEMRHQALHDPLTGLPNRVLLLDRLNHALVRAVRVASPVSVLFLDLDGFKRVNDSFGHDAGDELLGAVARRLQEVSRPQDTVARMSGDEFAVVCEGVDGAQAVAVAERIEHALAGPFELGVGSMLVGASIGVATAHAHGQSAEQLLHDADSAMYRAKQRGRGRVEVFDEQLRGRLLRLDEIERDLREAHGRGELRLVYQPILAVGAVGDDQIVGAEALVRWDHPRRGVLQPREFVPLAEARGLISPLGDWVIEEACRQAASWRAAAGDAVPWRVSINVFAHQLVQPGFVSRFESMLESSGAWPTDVILELTETAVTHEAQEAVRLIRSLQDLRALGVGVALDDFGTGYSSLAHLRMLPLDLLKVDRSFVAGFGQGGREHAIVSALAGLTQELGVSVLAEGVETPEQLIAVRALGFDLAQGFHIGRPVAPDELTGFSGSAPAGVADQTSGGAPAAPHGEHLDAR